MQLAELQPKPQTLNFNGHEFTMILINGEPYFNANEVANTLEFGNPHQAIATHVDKDDIQKMEVIDSLGRKQLANFLNESGLYALTFGSKKETAKKFKKKKLNKKKTYYVYVVANRKEGKKTYKSKAVNCYYLY